MAVPNFPNLFKVNLLVHKEEQEKLYRKFIRWALSSGRFIIIVVEMITIGAFVYRYKLDSDLMDIQDQINQQIPYIKSLSDYESLLKQTQFQLLSIKKLKNERIDYIKILTTLSKITPKNITLTGINIDSNQEGKISIVINGVTLSNLELSVFLKELSKNPDFTDINLTNIAFEGVTTFTITGNLSSKVSKIN